MCFDVTTNRVGAFARWSSDIQQPLADVSSDILVDRFDAISRGVASHELYKRSLKKLLDAAEAFVGADKPAVHAIKLHVDNVPARLRLDEVAPETERLIARLPPFSLNFIYKSVAWQVSCRATFTSCALEADSNLMKIWWSFDCLPTESWKEVPSNLKLSHAADMVKLTDRMADASFPDVFEACNSVISSSLHRDDKIHGKVLTPLNAYVRVAFSDNDHVEFAEFFDQVAFGTANASGSEQKSTDTSRLGREEFSKFVELVAGAEFDKELAEPRFERRRGGVAGLFLQYDAFPETKDLSHVTRRVVGFAQSETALRMLDPNPRWLRVENLPSKRTSETLAWSASRPLSRRLASRLAADLEKELQQ